MNLNQLEYFVAIVEKKSYSGAAHSLFVSPQAVSKAVGDLEREMQVDLLGKRGREIVPTPFGEIFYDKALELVCGFDDLSYFAQSHVENEPPRGSISLAIPALPFRGTVFEDNILDSFSDHFPFINLSLISCPSCQTLESVEENLVDAAIVVGRAPNTTCDYLKLFSFIPKILVSEKSLLSVRENIKLRDLRNIKVARPLDLRYCYKYIDKRFRRAGFVPHYIDLPPFIEEHQDFLSSDKGAIFVANDKNLTKLYSRAVLKDLAPESAFEIPVYFVSQEKNDSTLLSYLRQYLVRETKSNNRPPRGAIQRKTSRKL